MSELFKHHPAYREDPLIFEAVEAGKHFHGMTDANQYFRALCDSEPEFLQLVNNVYHYKDYYINVGKRFLMAGHGNCLMGLNGLELSCLPQGIALIWLDNKEDMVMITRIRGSHGRRLIPYREHGMGLSAQTRKNLLADVTRLLDENRALLAVTKDKDSWYILEGGERILFSCCEIAFVSDNAKAAYRSRVLEALDVHE